MICKSKCKMQKSKLQIKIQNNGNLYLGLRFCLLVIGAMFLPSLSLASSVYIDTGHSEFFVGDTILFNVRVDSENKDINAVEGEILLDHAVDAVSLSDINTSGSTFSLWPSKPLPSLRNARISFAGGSPGGFVSKDAIVFNVVLKLQETGQVALSPNNIEVYLNDGKGTKDEVHVKDLIIDILPRKSGAEVVDDWGHIVSNDMTPPEPFEIYVGQEDSVFDGKKFLSFSTTDAQSGISYYEVIESGLPPIRSNETYILQEQNIPTTVVVRAYDSAGNMRQSVYPPPTTKTMTETTSYSLTFIVAGIVVFLILLAVTVVVFRKLRKKRK